MQKRLRVRVLLCILALVALVVIFAPFTITLFYLPAYRGLGQGLTFLLLGGGTFYLGIKQIQAVERGGESLPWWKNYLIIMALFWGSVGILEFLTWLFTNSKPLHNEFNGLIGNSMLFLFILLTLVLGVYGISLSIVKATTSKKR